MKVSNELNKHGNREYTFSSMVDFANYINHIESNNIRTDGANTSSRKNAAASYWDNYQGLDGAIAMALKGGAWERGAKELQKVNLSESLAKYGLVPTYEIINDVQGGAVDIGAYLDDDEECFYRPEEVMQPQPMLKVCVVTGAPASFDAEELINRGRAILAVLDALEKRGYSIQLDIELGFYTASIPGPQAFITLKQSGEQWNAASVAYAIAHPAFDRRLGFRFAESADQIEVTTSGSYGAPHLREHERYDLYFPFPRKERYYTPEESIETIVSQIKAQQPELLPSA